MMRTGIVTGAVLAGVLLAAGPALAANPGPTQIDFTTGMFGLALGQVARVNAVNVTVSPGPISCQVELNFLDADGVAVYPLPQVNELAPGHSAFFDLPFEALPPTPVIRTMVRAVVQATCQSFLGAKSNPGPQQVNPGPIGITLEVYDFETGRASVMVEVQPGPIQ
jgi:hypothetical protein